MKRPDKLRTSAVIVAAGKGSRMNMDVNKQYIEVAGKPVVARTLQVFEDCEAVGEIILVVNHNDILYCKQNIVDVYGFEKVKSIVAGGVERRDSVYNGLKEVCKDCSIVLVHDGARPFVHQESIKDSIDSAYKYGAACVAVPVKDTIKRGDEEGFIIETLDRNTIWSIQTPQTFRYDLIAEAYKKALEEGYTGTDDAVLVEKLGASVKLVMGSYDNIKITTREDLAVGEAIANNME